MTGESMDMDIPLRLNERLFCDGETKDVKIETRDGILWAHSVILTTASDVIAGLLRNGVAAVASQKQLSWKDHPKALGHFFLRLVYTGTVDPDDWNGRRQELRSVLFDISETLGIFFDDDLNVRSVGDGSQAFHRGIKEHYRAASVAGQSIVSTKELVAIVKDAKNSRLKFITIEFVPSDIYVPLELLLGSLAIAKMYMFQDVLAVIVRSLRRRIGPDTLDVICSAAIATDLTSLRMDCLQYSRENETYIRESLESFSPEVQMELAGIWDDGDRPAKRYRLT